MCMQVGVCVCASLCTCVCIHLHVAVHLGGQWQELSVLPEPLPAAGCSPPSPSAQSLTPSQPHPVAAGPSPKPGRLQGTGPSAGSSAPG